MIRLRLAQCRPGFRRQHPADRRDQQDRPADGEGPAEGQLLGDPTTVIEPTIEPKSDIICNAAIAVPARASCR